MPPFDRILAATTPDTALDLRGPSAPARQYGYEVLKRVIDVGIALAAVTALAPLMIAAAIAIRLESPGPVLFRQQRNGRNGATFMLWKFRTMSCTPRCLTFEAQPQIVAPGHRKARSDSRVTRTGAFLRRWSIDELPNLLNVLRGDLSLVGPRPTRYSIDSYGRAASLITTVKPGVTGLWQVMGRGDLELSQRILLDCEYVRRRSTAMDLWILLMTVPAVLSGRGAY